VEEDGLYILLSIYPKYTKMILFVKFIFFMY
jgi:hypothetical protein